MSPAELCYRLGQYLRRAEETRSMRGWSRISRSGLLPSDLSFFRSVQRRLFIPPVWQDQACEARLLSGLVPVFRHWVQLRDERGFWHTDPLTGAEWPCIPWHKVSYRPGNPTGDVRTLWEINRLQYLHGLAMVADRDDSKRSSAVALVEKVLADWSAANPPGTGANYISAMEEALRLICLFHVHDLIRGQVSTQTRTVVATVISHHAWHIERRLSLYSSAGNHTVAEAVGLLYAGILLDDHVSAPRWKRIGLKLLRSEAVRQVDIDGGGIEQATWYLLFVVDLLGLAQSLLKHTGQRPEPLLDAAVARGRDFLNAIATGPEDLPRIGDADDGYALSPMLRMSWTGSAPAGIQRSFGASGLSVVRYGPEDRLLFLHNPLGMAPGYGHGHADCLSLVFRHAGVDLLIDPGTGQYGGSPEYRRYFRSAAAHNTVVIDGEDQAEQVATFMWRRPYRSDLLVSRFEPGCSTLMARHDGFAHLGITHWRGLIYQENGFLAVWDFLDGVTDRHAALHWHLGVRASMLPNGKCIGLECPGGPVPRMEIRGGAAAVLRGAGSPLLGWRSVAYTELEPCDVIRVGFRAGAEPVLTVLWLAEPGSVEDLLPRFAEFDTHRLAVSAS